MTGAYAWRILALGPDPWAGSWSGRQHLSAGLARRGHHVLYSTGLYYSWECGGDSWRKAPVFGGFQTLDGVVVDMPPKCLLRMPKFRGVDRVALRMGTRRLLDRLRRVGDGATAILAFHPRFAPYVESLPNLPVVYHAFDDFSLFGSWTGQDEDLERRLVRRSSVVLAVSEGVANALRSRYGCDVELLPNGANVEAFSKPSGIEPGDLSPIPRPRIGYIGRINRKIDLGLLATLAQRQQDWNFLLVGPVHNLTAEQRAVQEALEAAPNVHFLGEKAPSELPDYVAAMDVNVMPYATDVGQWSRVGYPLKLHEYLAAGVPVVSAPLPSVKPFGHVVALADGVQQWQQRIAEALRSGGVATPAERKAVAFENSWDRRLDRLERAFSAALAGRCS